MKQFNKPMLKALALYYLASLLCALTLSLFYYARWISHTVCFSLLIVIGCILCSICCIYMCKTCEKKTLLQISAFLIILLVISIGFQNFTYYSLIKLIVSLLLSLLLILRS